MGFVNFKRASVLDVFLQEDIKLRKTVFASLEPHEQLSNIDKINKKQLVAFYPHAKDDLVRFEIIKRTGDATLAKKLFHNTKYRRIKTRLVPFIKDEGTLKEIVISNLPSKARIIALHRLDPRKHMKTFATIILDRSRPVKERVVASTKVKEVSQNEKNI